MSKLHLSLVLVLVLVSAACRSSGGDDDGGGTPDAGGSGDMAIYDVQSETVAVGDPVTLRGVVVTAIDAFGGRTGGFYVQEPAGGAFSGVAIFATGTVAADLVPGDVVDIEGAVKDEFAYQDFDPGYSITQLRAAEGVDLVVTKTGTAEVPAAELLDPWTLAGNDDEAEKWEGVLIKFTGARVFFEPGPVSSTDDTLKEMTVTGPYRISSSLTALADTIARDTCYASITGIGDYFFTYKVLPRSADDLVVGADSDCLPVEATIDLCGDTTDNDYNGFADCGDFGCQDAVASCTTDVTIAEIQTGAVPAEGRVRITDAVVSARAFNGNGIWLQTAGAGGENLGVFVFSQSGGVDFATDIAGDTVTLTATVSEFDCNGACTDNKLTEVGGAEVEASTAGTTSPAPVTGLTVAQAAAEGYEGVLVTLANVTVGAKVDVMRGTGNLSLVSREFEISAGGTTIHVDDDIFRATVPTVGFTCDSITGIMHFNTNDGSDAGDDELDGGLAPHVTILPRSAGDIVNCN